MLQKKVKALCDVTKGAETPSVRLATPPAKMPFVRKASNGNAAGLAGGCKQRAKKKFPH